MGLLILPMFLPLLLIGWFITPADERELRCREAVRERQFGETWAQLFAREGELPASGALVRSRDGHL